MKRRIFILFSLIVPMLFASVGILESALYSVWDGTSEPPEWVASDGGYYRINSAAQFAGMRDWVNAGLSADKKYVLGVDIDLCGIEWVPIGSSSSNPFKGHFDGGGHVIANLSVKNPPTPGGNANYAGLFGRVYSAAANGAELSNVQILSADIDATQASVGLSLNVGVLAGELYNGRAVNCYILEGSILADSNESTYAGGLIGQTSGTDSTVERCIAVASLRTSARLYVITGGLVGWAQYTQIQENTVNTNILTTRPNSNSDIFSTGGIVGRMNKTAIRDCTAYGTIATSSTDSKNYTGGIAGRAYQTDGTIETSASFVELLTATAVTGGIIGTRESTTAIVSCDWFHPNNGIEAGIGDDRGSPGIIQLTHARSRNQSEFRDESDFRARGWDFDGVWCYTPLDRWAAPNLAFVFTDGARRILSPDLLPLFPGSMAIEAGDRATVKIFSGIYEIDDLKFDGGEHVSAGGVTIRRHPASSDRFVVSADGYVTGAAREIEVSALIGGVAQPKKFRLSISGDLEISTDALPAATRGTPYLAAIETKNARGPASFAAVGAMPPGLGLAADTGLVSGTPTEAGAFGIAVAVTDTRHTVQRRFALTVGEAIDADPTNPTEPTAPDTPAETAEESLTNLLSDLNASLGDAQIGVLQSVGGNGVPIASLRPEDLSLSIRRKSELGSGYIALADSFFISAQLSGQTQGDRLALAYAVDLTKAEGFADWPNLDTAERTRRLEKTGIAAVYAYEGTATFATLIGEGGLSTWRDALLAGAVRTTASGVAVHYAVTDGEGAPYLDGAVVVVPDGAPDGRIEDPLWLARSAEEKTSTRGSVGCTGGSAAALAAAALFARLQGREKRKRS